MKKPEKRILVIKFQNIGDVLLTTPLISTLKKEILNASVCAAVKYGTDTLLEKNPDLDGIHVLPKQKKGENLAAFLVRYIIWIYRLRKNHFDIAINTTKGDHGILIAWLSGASKVIGLVNERNVGKGIYRLIGLPITPPSKPTHTVLRNLHLAEGLAQHQNLLVTVFLDAEVITKTQEILLEHGVDLSHPFVHIHPTSRWMFKCWPDKFMAETIDWLASQGLQVVLTASPENKETDRIKNILQLCATTPANLAGKLTLKQTATISSMATLFFGVDSAPMHMAAAVNTPVVALFGPSSATHWGPWPNTLTLPRITASPYSNKNGIQNAGGHTIIQKEWACVPCQQSGCEKSKKSACLDTLKPAAVIDLLKRHIHK
jgi:heptosyltransferase-3